MTAEQFAYWLQGFVELQGSVPTDEQWKGIKDHLQTVFKKVTPAVQVNFPAPGFAHDLLARPGGKSLKDCIAKFHDGGFVSSGPLPVLTC